MRKFCLGFEKEGRDKHTLKYVLDASVVLKWILPEETYQENSITKSNLSNRDNSSLYPLIYSTRNRERLMAGRETKPNSTNGCSSRPRFFAERRVESSRIVLDRGFSGFSDSMQN